MALTLCVMLVSSAMVFTAYAESLPDAKTVLAVYDFEDYDVGAQISSIIKVGGTAKAAYRSVVDGAEQSEIKYGKALQITQYASNDKHKIKDLITSSVVKKNVEYVFAITAKMADSSPVETQTAVLELYSDTKTNAVYTSEPVELTQNEWKTITYTYSFNDSTSVDKIATMVGTRLTGAITTGSEPVYLIDDVRIIRNAADTSSFDKDSYDYVSKVNVNMDKSTTHYFSSGARVHTTEYNYSGNTMGAIHYNGGIKDRSRFRARNGTSSSSNPNSTGLVQADELVVGKKYRYSAMMRISDLDTKHSAARVNFGTHTDTSGGAFNTQSAFTIYKDAWTMVWVEEVPTDSLKSRTLAFQMVPDADGETYYVVIDDFKIEEMTPAVPLETSFAFGGETATSLEEAGDYTANVKFGKNFANDTATVAFVKYVDGMVAEKEVIAQADLANGATKTFTITADELETAQLSVFVWNNINDLFPLMKGLTIAK